MASTKEKRSFAVYRSNEQHERGELISNAHAKQWNKVAKKYAFHGLPASTDSTWVRVELRQPGRGVNPSKAYQLVRKMVTASESYRNIAVARNYKNVDEMPLISIVGKPVTVVPNKRKSSGKKAAEKSGSKSQSHSRSASPAKEKSQSRSRSASPKAKPAKTSKSPKKAPAKKAAAARKSPAAEKASTKKKTAKASKE